jgi:hypothetical protein
MENGSFPQNMCVWNATMDEVQNPSNPKRNEMYFVVVVQPVRHYRDDFKCLFITNFAIIHYFISIIISVE